MLRRILLQTRRVPLGLRYYKTEGVDYYFILGVERNAEVSAIKAAFRKVTRPCCTPAAHLDLPLAWSSVLHVDCAFAYKLVCPVLGEQKAKTLHPDAVVSSQEGAAQFQELLSAYQVCRAGAPRIT